MTENRLTTTPADDNAARPAPVMPSAPLPESPPEQITALDALHFGWHPLTMRSVDQILAHRNGAPYEPSGTELMALRAWVTATDERIGHVVYATEQDPQGFAFVAREVTALDDQALLERYQERRRVTASARYQVRTVEQVAPQMRARLLEDYERAAGRYTGEPDSEQGVKYREAAEAIRAGSGYVLWDRINHGYAVAVWRRTAQEITAECDRRNQRHEQGFGADPWR